MIFNKIKRAFIWIGLVLIFLVSCTNVTDNFKTIKIDSADFSNWEELLEITDIVPLEEDSCYLISIADKCIFSKDYLFLSDYKTKKIYKYSKNGNFLGTIGKRGHAKNEYTDILDMWLTDNDSTLVILDTRSLLFYCTRTGEYRKTVRNKNYDYERFAIQNDGNILFVPDIDGKASIISDGIDGVKEIRERKRVPFIVNTFYNFENTCRVVSDYGDFYIDTYNDGELIKTYSFDFGTMALPEKLSSKTYEEFEKIDSEPNYFKCITQAFETRNILYVKFVGPNQTFYSLFYDKRNNKHVIGPSPQGTGIMIIGADNEYIYGIIYPDYIEDVSIREKIVNITKSPAIIKIQIKHEVLS